MKRVPSASWVVVLVLFRATGKACLPCVNKSSILTPGHTYTQRHSAHANKHGGASTIVHFPSGLVVAHAVMQKRRKKNLQTSGDDSARNTKSTRWQTMAGRYVGVLQEVEEEGIMDGADKETSQ